MFYIKLAIACLSMFFTCTGMFIIARNLGGGDDSALSFGMRLEAVGLATLLLYAGVRIGETVYKHHLEAEGRIVTVTEQTNLTPANYDLSKGDTVQIDFVTPDNSVSIGDIVAFYDTNSFPQVGLVTAINDDTVTVFMNAYSDNGTVGVPMQSIYGIATPYVEEGS